MFQVTWFRRVFWLSAAAGLLCYSAAARAETPVVTHWTLKVVPARKASGTSAAPRDVEFQRQADGRMVPVSPEPQATVETSVTQPGAVAASSQAQFAAESGVLPLPESEPAKLPVIQPGWRSATPALVPPADEASAVKTMTIQPLPRGGYDEDVPAIQPAPQVAASTDGAVVPCPPVSGRQIDPRDYERVYRSIPFLRTEYEANRSYRHDATMEILLGVPRPVAPQVNVKVQSSAPAWGHPWFGPAGYPLQWQQTGVIPPAVINPFQDPYYLWRNYPNTIGVRRSSLLYHSSARYGLGNYGFGPGRWGY